MPLAESWNSRATSIPILTRSFKTSDDQGANQVFGHQKKEMTLVSEMEVDQAMPWTSGTAPATASGQERPSR